MTIKMIEEADPGPDDTCIFDGQPINDVSLFLVSFEALDHNHWTPDIKIRRANANCLRTK